MRNERFANNEDIKFELEDQTDNKTGGGPILFHENGKNYAYTGEAHTGYIGVSGSGKSRRGTMPLIRSFIENNENFIAVDPKGELYDKTQHYAKEEDYKIYTIDFRDVFKSTKYNPLALIADLYYSENELDKHKACEYLDELANTLYPIDDKSDPFWPECARSMFVGSSYALLEQGKKAEVNIASVYNLISLSEVRGPKMQKQIDVLLSSLGENSPASMLLKSYATTCDATKSSMRSTFLEGISFFARSPGTIQMLSLDDLQINNLDGKSKIAIYIIIPDESDIYDKICGILVSQLMSHFLKQAQDKFNGKLPIRLNVVLEELGNIGKALPSLPHLLSAGRSRNIRVQYVLQSLSQLNDIYSQAGASTIISNTDIMVVYRTNNWETLTEFSNKCGERKITYGNSSSTEPLLTQAQLGALKTGQALVMISGRLKFVTYLPDYTDMFDCSDWQAPSPKEKSTNFNISIFDYKPLVEKIMKKENEKQQEKDTDDVEHKFTFNNHHSPAIPSPEEMAKMLKDIDKQIAEFEAKEKAEKKAARKAEAEKKQKAKKEKMDLDIDIFTESEPSNSSSKDTNSKNTNLKKTSLKDDFKKLFDKNSVNNIFVSKIYNDDDDEVEEPMSLLEYLSGSED